MKALLVSAFLLAAHSNVFASQGDTTSPENKIPNAILEPRMPMKKLKETPGNTLYELPGGMACIAPDSSFRSDMPVKKYVIMMRPATSSRK